ncbi:hypothetical protein THF1C08_80023 [Vibrio jasicida]|uniref:Uncharacterized protein n=1 Tax=Vibrio jasicida TaxID=766224 RepID=A0AAU9QVW9_9VIBR|nr:hypothetical protein THF1C08_80023 [Vibrio jasicida]CAH1603300.1 hypothetical protein THF1A12_70023 [Vibrio jasicida]
MYTVSVSQTLTPSFLITYKVSICDANITSYHALKSMINNP